MGGRTEVPSTNEDDVPQNEQEQMGSENSAEVYEFEHEGNLTFNNPGMRPDVWYIVYDEPGAPGKFQELLFTEVSECIRAQGVSTICDLSLFTPGDRVLVRGNNTENAVVVSELEFVEP
jgi:hypothetical protein